MAKGRIIRDYFIGIGLTLSIIGIPLVLGYVNDLASKKLRSGDKSNTRIMLGSYAPIIDRLLSGILILLFGSLPFAFIFFVQAVYAWSLSTEIGSMQYIQSITSVISVFLSLLGTYTIPFFLSMQPYRSTYDRTIDQVLFQFIIPNIYSKNYLKYFIVFFILTIGFSSVSYAGTLSLVFYFFAIMATPIYMIGIGNIVGSGAYKIEDPT